MYIGNEACFIGTERLNSRLMKHGMRQDIQERASTTMHQIEQLLEVPLLLSGRCIGYLEILLFRLQPGTRDFQAQFLACDVIIHLSSLNALLRCSYRARVKRAGFELTSTLSHDIKGGMSVRLSAMLHG